MVLFGEKLFVPIVSIILLLLVRAELNHLLILVLVVSNLRVFVPYLGVSAYLWEKLQDRRIFGPCIPLVGGPFGEEGFLLVLGISFQNMALRIIQSFHLLYLL